MVGRELSICRHAEGVNGSTRFAGVLNGHAQCLCKALRTVRAQLAFVVSSVDGIGHGADGFAGDVGRKPCGGFFCDRLGEGDIQDFAIRSRGWLASTILTAVLPHEGMLPVGRLSFWPRLSLFNSMVEGCGHVVEGCGGG